MSVWLIGGGVYAAAMSVAFVLCRAASGDFTDERVEDCVDELSVRRTERERRVGATAGPGELGAPA